MDLLEESWEQREEVIYKSLFSDLGEGIYPLDAELFKTQFDYENIDPRWMHLGVFKCPPTSDRKTWLYVSSGMSNPWESEEPEDYSGYGTEFILETEIESDWAINVLRSLIAFNILVAIGNYGDKPLLDIGDRVPYSIEPNIKSMMIVAPSDYPESFDLKSGKVDFLQVVGITEDELVHAQENGSDELAKLLLRNIKSFVTDAGRHSVLSV